MFAAEVLLVSGLLIASSSSDEVGVIRGRVVNMSRGEAPCAGAQVILRARVRDEFVPLDQTTADADGQYRFEGLPVGPEYLYLPGANYQEIHYPGRRAGLTRGLPSAFVTLDVWDAVSQPSPLVIRRHEIVIGVESEAVHVVEAMLVDNPASATYVGQAANADSPSVTLRLNVPADFEQITFEQEKFGREFRVVDGKLVTGVPWMPGPQWLRFTYTLRLDSVRGGWQRALDAPCESLRLRVKHAHPEDVTCDLPTFDEHPPGEAAFQSDAGILPAGHVIRVQLGRVPVAATVYARWGALAVLACLIGGTGMFLWRARRSSPVPTAVASEPCAGQRARTRERRARRAA